MTSKVLLTGFLRKGKQVLEGVLRAKTQNVGVKVAEIPKPKVPVQQVVRYQSQLTQTKLVNIWQKILPRVYFNSLASRFGREAAWRFARNVPLFSFVGIVMAQHAEKEEDEIIEKIHEFVKAAQVTSSPLLQQVQQLSLEKFEFGQLIGQGCNAAVYEARLHVNNTDDNSIEPLVESHIEPVSTTNSTSETVNDLLPVSFQNDVNYDSDTGSDVTVISVEDNGTEDCDLDFQVPAEMDISFDLGFDMVSETGSDIEILAFSDDDMEDEDKAPREFKVLYTAEIPDNFDADSDISLLSFPDDTFEDETSSGQNSRQVDHTSEPKLTSHLELEATGQDKLPRYQHELSLSMSCSQILASLKDGGQADTHVEEVTDNLEESLQYTSLESNLSTETSDKFNLAVKMMFNYGIESNASAILQEMEREMVPARLAETREQMDAWQNGNKVRKKRLPPHPNIVEMWGVFVDPVPHLPDSLLNYPAALPARLNPQGIGRNKTLFLVMKKYHCTLAEYLSTFNPSMRDRIMLLAQVFEGLDHMRRHNIAHRDLKLDNIFLDTFTGGVPQLVIGDFGCCLADSKHGLQIPYTSEYIDKGGNTALMAPEISSAQPGLFTYLDYRKSDIWAAGTLAYQILGADNPFYTNQSKGRLDSRTYAENDLPPLPEDVPGVVKELIKAILKRDPAKGWGMYCVSTSLLQISGNEYLNLGSNVYFTEVMCGNTDILGQARKMQLYPSEIKYSQDSISSSFSYGRSIGQTLDDLCEKRISIDDIPQISVYKSGRVWISDDNRRLWVFKQLERLGKCRKINVEEVPALSYWKSSQGYDEVRIRGGDPGGLWHSRSAGFSFGTKLLGIAAGAILALAFTSAKQGN